MKRTPEPALKDHHGSITSCWPLFFWKQCLKCGQEWRREKGWEVYGGPYCGGRGLTEHLCGSCAPTKARAVEIINNRGTRPNVTPVPLGGSKNEA